ncbi:unnamed protein product [Paramecium primaurelia]|uniref:Transmembrane protein n=1 Tax=Paramecium primaurelia TaxID=5886 RepID=A0A8S1M2K9_PARPR|nr:unnamed protein product [Paramecium primaurelia]
MMQQRDFYGNDYIYKHIKQVSLQEFTDQLFNPVRHQKQMVLFTQNEQKEQQELYKYYVYLGGGVFAVSALSVIFYKKIPFLNRIEKRWARILTKALLLFGPLQVQSIFGQRAQYELLDKQFIQYHRQLQDYMFSGDIRKLKQDIQISPV